MAAIGAVGSTVIVGGVASIGLVKMEKQFHEEANMHWGSETGWNDASDAFRHSYVSARFAQYFGETTPNILGILHESMGAFGEKPDPRDQAMDIYNNKYGSEVGDKYDANDYEAPQKIAEELKKAIEEGKLITNFEKDPRINPSLRPKPQDYPQPHECTPYDMDGDGIPDSIDRDPFTPYLDPNSDWPQWAKDLANKTYRVEYYDPLALDLNGDGAITTLAEANSAGALFDHDGDGIRTATGWIAPQDGILVRDINGNGIIDNGKELFGDNTILKNGQKAISGMAALADLDSNSDGIIDDKDEAFDSLKVWQDKNGDGISTADELVSLATAGITSINVKDKQTINEKTSGGFIKDQATFTKDDGTTSQMEDINFTNDAVHSQYIDQVAVSDTVAKLPNLKGFGRLADLHQAAMKSPELAAALENYSHFTTRAEQKVALDNIMILWAKTDPQYVDNQVEIANLFTIEWQQDPNSTNVIRLRRGEQLPGYISQPPQPKVYADDTTENKIKFSEAALGNNPSNIYYQLGKNDNLTPMLDIYDKTKDALYHNLLSQTLLKPYLDSLKVVTNGDRFAEINKLFDTNYHQNGITALEDLKDLLTLHGQSLDSIGWDKGFVLLQQWRAELSAVSPEIKAHIDEMFKEIDITANGTAKSNAVTMLNDETQTSFSASTGNDKIIINTQAGKTVNGDNGDDIIVSGKGNDTINGGTGFNSYVFFKGAGKDTVVYDNAGAGFDKLAFVDIKSSDAVFYQKGNDLVIRYGGDEVTLTGALSTNSSKHILLNFSDKTVFLTQVLMQPLQNILLDDNANIQGWRGADLITGDDQANKIYAKESNDTINAKAGNDYIDGGTGNNTYLFKAGDGKDIINYDNTGKDTDTIILDAVQSKDIILTKNQNNLIINYGNGDSITLVGALDTTSTKVVNFKFSDTQTSLSELLQRPIESDISATSSEYIYGWRGADHMVGDEKANAIYGYEGDDYLEGKTGDDSLDGGKGNNTYVFNVNDGKDNISYDYLNTTDTDTIIIKGVNSSATILYKQDDNLVVKYSDNDTITLNNALLVDAKKQVNIQFDDKTVSLTKLLATPLNNIDSSQLTIEGWRNDDNLIGNEANNQLSGLTGNDSLTGNKGNDKLIGGTGIDTYHFSRGDGIDEILEDSYSSEANHIIFRNINPTDIQKVSFESNDLIVQYSQDDKIILKNYLANSQDSTLTMQFADGTTWQNNELMAKATLEGSNKTDTITGTLNDRPNIINAHAGNDTVHGNKVAQNIIDGGDGWDELHGGDNTDAINGGTGEDFIYGEAGNDHIDGGDDHDTLFGGDGDDTIIGGLGNDWLQGDAGKDTLIGGLGDDSYDVDDLDTFIENPNEGYDAIFIANDFDLAGTNLEEIHLKGNGNFKAIGDAGDNGLYGNEGNNYLDGKAGADIMSGGAGDDYYVVDKYETLIKNPDGTTTYVHGDQVVEGNLWENYVQGDSGGNDTVEQWDDHHFYRRDETGNWVDTGSFSLLQNNIENLILKGQAKTAFGNELDNIITLNEQNNFVNALAGNDTIIYQKGGGQDTILNADTLTSQDTLVIEGYNLSDAIFMRLTNTASQHDMLQIRFKGTNDQITLLDYFADEIDGHDNRIDQIRFNNGNQTITLSQSEFETKILAQTDNHAPQVNKYPSTIHGEIGKTLSVSFDKNTIKDVDIYDSELKYTITLTTKDGEGNYEPIPDWLVFDPNTLTLTGIPPQGTTSNYQFILWGQDTFNHSAGTYVTLNITHPTPVVNEPVSSNPVVVDETIKDTKGNDTLKGTNKDNVFIYTAGVDTLVDTGGQDTLVFSGQVGSGLMSSGNDLILRVGGSTANQITLKDYFASADNIIETIKFETGGEIGYEKIYELFGKTVPTVSHPDIMPPTETPVDTLAITAQNNFIGTTHADKLIGTDSHDQLQGLAGNDTLTAKDGHDILIGGAGNDILTGGNGNDLYYFTKGFGRDTIVGTGGGFDNIYFDGIDFNQVGSGLTKHNNNLILKVSGTDDQITIQDFFLGGDNADVNISFASGGSIGSSQLLNLFKSSKTPTHSQVFDYDKALLASLGLMETFKQLELEHNSIVI